MVDGSMLKVVGKLQLMTSESCGLWQKNCMRNGEKICRERVK